MGVERKQESVGEREKKEPDSKKEGRNGEVKLVMEGHTDCWLHGLRSKGRAVRRCNPEDLSAAKLYLCGILCDCAAAGFESMLYRNMPQTRPARTGFSRIFLMNFLFSKQRFFFFFCCKGSFPWGPVFFFFFFNKMFNTCQSCLFLFSFTVLSLCRSHV